MEAASQILERDGPAGFNTASVAERAGVSIGTLYQYFPDKQAILLAAAQRELGRETPPGRQQALMRALIDFLESIGRLTGRAPARVDPAPRRASRRRRELERRILAWIEAAVLVVDQAMQDLALAPAPKPIPVRVRRRRS